MNIRHSLLNIQFYLGALILLSPALVTAQEQDELALEEVIVTAERRQTSIQEIPMSVTAITADRMDAMGIRSSQDLQNIVPGLTIRSPQIGQNNFVIRGIGAANDDVSSDSGVGVFVDDIYMARTSAANLTLYDLERVEVLRGPQGTLYGRNTAGGSINIITSKPGDVFEGKVGLDVGSEGLINAKAFLSGPLIEGKLFAKASMASFNRDGIMKNLYDGAEGNKIDTLTGRVGLRYLASDRVELLLTLDSEKTRPGPNLKSLGPEDGFENIGTLPSGPQPAADPVRSANVNNSTPEEFDTTGVMARMNVDYDAATLSLIGGYREEQTYYNEDFDRSPDDNLNEVLDEDGSWGSLELRLSSNPGGSMSAGGRLNWTGGLYYFTEDTSKTLDFESTTLPFILCNFVFPPFACPDTPPGTSSVVKYFQQIETDAYAAFGQATYDLSDRWALTAGLRYTSEAKDFTALGYVDGPMQPPFNPLLQEDIDCKGAKDFSNVSGKLALDFKFSDNVLFYGSFSQGYRSGGFNGQAPNNEEACGGFDEETANNLEFGLKADWADNRIRTNISVFYTDYSDLQVTVIPEPGSTPTTTNAADSEITGAEIEFEALVTQNFSLHGNAAFLDATYKDFVTFEQGELVDKSGQPIAEVPETTWNLGFLYDYPLNGGAHLSLRGDYIWEGETKVVGALLPQWESANFSLAYQPQSQNWMLSAWVRNAFDELYWTATGVGDTADINAMPRLLEAPRTYGISFEYFIGN